MSKASRTAGARFSLRALTSPAPQATRIGSVKMCGRASTCGMTRVTASAVAIIACTGTKLRSSSRSSIATAAAAQKAVTATSPAQPNVSNSQASRTSPSHSWATQDACAIVAEKMP